ncbi:AAA family ATPase [Georgenia subflava]|uniref:AAA family ATPase n=1 Tax=Georgenia subflava TaxID=1622177 RepID=A0A6N7EGF6_9MICO|nr:AAA family ATPase [Georgenia subflava]MPV35767.1 AAA family ATPase [Georgenia subflava]
MLTAVAVRGYRSLRDVVLPLGALTVVTGPNGSGKSNLYRALHLLAATAREGAPAALAREGGLASALWAGPEQGGGGEGTVRRRPVRVELGVTGDDTGYALTLGLPQVAPEPPSPFARDPEIKAETVWAGPLARPASVLTERRGPHVRTRTDDGWATLTTAARPHESMLDVVADPNRSPELVTLREELRSWRLYDHLRTDPGAPARQPRPGSRTSALAADGADLAAALASAADMGADRELTAALEDAFPGSRLRISAHEGVFEVLLHQPGLLRPLHAAELSDGTLRFLMVAAALLTPRPPQLIVLNEPEQSMHPSVLPALARMTVRAARRTQVVMVTHSTALSEAVAAAAADTAGSAGTTRTAGTAGTTGATPTTGATRVTGGGGATTAAGEDDAGRVVAVELAKEAGETVVVGQEGPLDRPAWHWP